MFETISRSWKFAKISYGIIWDFKHLLAFPILAGVASLLVLASFALPLWGMGTIEQWMTLISDENAQPTNADKALFFSLAFIFYFCNFFVVVFFNTALCACVMQVIEGKAPSIEYGLKHAAARLPQILAWAFVSALVGVLLRAIEGINEKVGRWVAAILGAGWAVLTFFVVPVIVSRGAGPVDAIKHSGSTMTKTWGTSLVGRFSLGLLAFLLTLPAIFLGGLLVVGAVITGSLVLIILAAVCAVGLLVIVGSANAAADIVFRAILYNYATGQSLPQGVERVDLAHAFVTKS